MGTLEMLLTKIQGKAKLISEKFGPLTVGLRKGVSEKNMRNNPDGSATTLDLVCQVLGRVCQVVQTEDLEFLKRINERPTTTGVNYLYTRRPTPTPLAFAMFNSFPALVWSLILGSVVLVGLSRPIIDMFLTRSSFSKKELRKGLGGWMLLIQQGSISIEKLQGPARWAFAAWGVVTVALTGSFSGNLLATLIQKKYRHPYTSFAGFGDCLKRKECLFFDSAQGSNFWEEIRSSKDVEMNSIRDGLKISSPLILNFPRFGQTLENYFEKALSFKDIYLATYLDAKSIFRAWGDRSKRCKFYFVKTPVSNRLAFPFSKGNPWIPVVDEAILYLHSYGLLDANITDVGCEPQRSTEINLDDGGKGLPFTAVFSVFLLLLSGVGLGLLLFFCERLKNYQGMKKVQENRTDYIIK